MNRSTIIALLIFGAILAYFLSFGADGTRKVQAGFYKVMSPFLSSGSGLKKQISSVSTGLQTLEELERENNALKVENRSLKATNQALRDIEHEVIPWCEANDVAVVGYTPFGRSAFPPPGTGGKVLAQVAKRRGATTRQVALAFLTRLPSLFAIPKASNIEHVRENLAAAER